MRRTLKGEHMNANKTLLHSVDVKVYKSGATLFIVVYTAYLLISNVAYSIKFWDDLFTAVGPVLVINLAITASFFPGIWYYTKRILHIVKRSHAFIFGECTLSETGCAKGHYYFWVKLKTTEGTVETCTSPIYSDTSTYACYQDWKTKRVIAAYDREDNIAIVIGKPTEEWKQLLSSE